MKPPSHRHLSPLDFQALLEGLADLHQVAHLAGCPLCQAEFKAELQAEVVLLALAPHVCPLDEVSSNATEGPKGGWDEISGIRPALVVDGRLAQESTSSTPGGGSPRAGAFRSAFRSMITYGALAAACWVCPWLNFRAQPVLKVAVLTSVPEARCLNSQPWCR